MKRFISAASIGQFRETVAQVNRTHNFVGLDENGDAIYDPSLKKPCKKFLGTIKLHGTFSAVCYNEVGGIWAQSKENVITPYKQFLYEVKFEDETKQFFYNDEIIDGKNISDFNVGDTINSLNIIKIERDESSDNCGFAFFVESRKEVYISLIKSLAKSHNIDLKENTIFLGAEWAGQGIQKSVGISEIDKSSFILSHAKVSPFDTKKDSHWISTNNIDSIEDRIYNLDNFKTFSIDIDFNRPDLSQNKMIDMMLEVEAECPVSKEFGHSGIGEGIVFAHLNEDGSRYIFKVKGDKHSKSKTKTLKRVDDEKVNKIIEIAEQVTPSWRLSQMIAETFNTLNGGVIDRTKLGDYIRAVMNDIIKEEIDIISDAGLELRDIAKYVSTIARDYFFEYERNDLGV